MHEAAAAGSLEGVKLLVKFGANVGAVNSKERTPLQEAKRSGFSEIVEYLGELTPTVKHSTKYQRLQDEMSLYYNVHLI